MTISRPMVGLMVIAGAALISAANAFADPIVLKFGATSSPVAAHLILRRYSKN